MNRSQNSQASDVEKRGNQAFGTQVPGSSLPGLSSGGGASQVEQLQRTLATPAYQTYSPPTGPGGTEKDLPNPAVFSSVYKTSGSQDTQVLNLAELFPNATVDLSFNGETREGHTAEKLDGTIPHLADSDFLKTLNLPDEDLPAFKPSGAQSYQRTIELPGGGTDLPPRTSSSGGKSTWQLQIRAKSINGYVSGVRNRVPTSTEEAVGFLSAFVDKPDVAEYEVLKELGKGNMGIVYEARQSSLNRELAIKALNPKDGSARYEQEMFVSEAVVTANLVHPNIVPIHDLGRTEDGKLFYSMKKVTGVSWDKTIREKTLEDNLDIFMKVCDAVAYAHSRGVVNRDLKPENVVVGNYGEVVVLDWGLAVTNEKFPKQESILLDYRGGAGTPVYMAPELVSDDISVVGDHSDIYLLGAILFEVLEGFPPHLLRAFWNLENPHEQFASIVTAVMTNQIETQVVHPGELMDIAFKAMATNPQHRFESVEEMQEFIRQYRITGHAEEFYHSAAEAGKNQSYDHYQASVALFSEALRKWPNNERAQIGDRLARKGFAELALHKGDFDLGLHLIENNEGSEFDSLRKKLKRDQSRRSIIKRTWMGLAAVVVILAGVTLVVSKSALALGKEAENARGKIKSAEQDLAKIENQKVELTAQLSVAAAAQKEAEVKVQTATTKLVEVESAKKEADDAKLVADKAKAEAEKQANEAKMLLTSSTEELKKVQMAKKEADEQAALAQKKANEAEAATKLAEKAKAEAEGVLAEAQLKQQKAEDSLLDTEWKKFNLQFNLFVNLGQIEEAYDEVKKALDKAAIDKGLPGHNPNFQRRKRDILRKAAEIKVKAAELEKNRQTQVKNLQGDVKTAAIGATGRVIAFATPNKVEILQAKADAEQLFSSLQEHVFDDLKVQVQLTVSPDEQFLIAIGRNYKRLWSLKGEFPVSFTLPDLFGADAPPAVADYKVARFSPDGHILFLISNDHRMTLEMYDLTDGHPKPLVRTTIAGNSEKDFTITDFFLMPELATDGAPTENLSMVYLVGSGGTSTCKSLRVNFLGDLPILEDHNTFNDARNEGFRQEEMQGLMVSPDFQKMAIRVGNKSLQIFTRSDSKVPFAPLPENSMITCDNTISSIAFSADGNRLIAGSTDGYIEIWSWNESSTGYTRYDPPKEHALWKQHRVGGFSSSPSACSFVGKSIDDIVAIGLTDQENRSLGHSVIRWDLQHYNDYFGPILELGVALFAEPDPNGAKLPQVTPVNTVQNHTERIPADLFARKLSSHLQTVGFNQAEEAKPEAEKISRWRVSGFARSAESARFSQDGQRILVAADDRAAHVFARDKATVMITGGRRSRFYEPQRNVFEEGHIPELSEIMFLPPDGRRLLTKDFFGAVSVWDASIDEDGFAREVSRMLTSDFGLAASPDGKWVVASARDSVEVANDKGERESRTLFVAKLWDTSTFESDPTPDPVRTFGGKHERLITAIAISSDSSLVVTADRRGHIVVWDLMTAEVIAEIIGTHGNDQISGIAFLNPNELISSGFDGTIQRWLIKQDKLVAADGRFQFSRPDSPDDYVISLMISPDRRQFATVSVKNGGRVPNPNTAAGEPELIKGPNLVRFTVWSLDLPTQPRDLATRDWPQDKSEFDQGVSWSMDGKSLAHIYPVKTLGDDFLSELSLYDTTTWAVKRKFQPIGLTGTASRIAFSPVMHEENEELIATFDGRVAHLWGLAQGKHLTEFRSHETVYSADFSADRMLVATASDSLRIFVGDERSESHGSTVFRKTDAHAGRIEEVQFSKQPKSYDFMTLGGDMKIKKWNWTWTPNEVATPPANPTITIDLTPAPADPNVKWDSTLSWDSSLDWSDSGNLLTATFAGELYAFVQKENKFSRLPLPLPVEINAKFNCCSISADEKNMAAGGVRLKEDGRTIESFSAVWTLQDDGTPLLAAIFEGKHLPNRNSMRVAGTTAISFGPDGLTLLTGGTDGRVLEWDWEERLDGTEPLPSGDQFTLYLVDNFNPHGTSTVTSINVSKSGDIVSSGADGYVAFWPAIKVEL